MSTLTAIPVTVATARQFVAHAVIPDVTTHREVARDASGPALADAFDSAKNQASVVGSEVISFVEGVTAERRLAVVNSSLLAQLVARKKVTDLSEVDQWYNAYFDTLINVGWIVQDRSFAEYHESGNTFTTHKAILAVASTLLGPASTALALVTTTMNALQSMDEGSPWITLFNQESQTASTGRFQISLVEQDPAGQFLVSIMAFSMKAKSKITQILFFKARTSDVVLRHSSGRVTINTDVLDSVSPEIKTKLRGHASEFVKLLPDL